MSLKTIALKFVADRAVSFGTTRSNLIASLKADGILDGADSVEAFEKALDDCELNDEINSMLEKIQQLVAEPYAEVSLDECMLDDETVLPIAA